MSDAFCPPLSSQPALCVSTPHKGHQPFYGVTDGLFLTKNAPIPMTSEVTHVGAEVLNWWSLGASTLIMKSKAKFIQQSLKWSRQK